ncbi:hypothetical protein AKJ09_05791 [Labilithrix luteola]|uniref:Tat (Twin-arginine translocation) pathway signal sequence domain protein n=1 Tax=Labilithrix luteola TaxID=1391654 RepID=A0A0K1Q054_9BACT|nr:DUF1501 domain-containing protein [Labilithrix luteola]AKU99127.1 hypothetical protein AKJ09_05791 [Labilithrix luteola]
MTTRRNFLLTSLFGAGLVGLRSLATGLPISFLLNPTRAMADEPPPAAQFLILSTSGTGDPINANAPGTYDLTFAQKALHPASDAMAATPISLGGKSWNAARPWSTLTTLDRTQFFHHATLTNNHSDQQKVMSLMGATKNNEMAVSIYSAYLQTVLGTIQAQPIALDREVITFAGATVPRLAPSALTRLLAAESAGLFTDLQKIRDADLNRINDVLKAKGTNVQRKYLDDYATTQTQVRQIPQDLQELLAKIRGNEADDQATAAAILIKMKVSPVVVMHVPFGGDNHSDDKLDDESDQTVTGVATINKLMATLKSLGIQDQVTFATLNVFGRSLAQGALAGRSHWSNHHTALVIGKPFKPGVIGGLVPIGDDLGAAPIDSGSGNAADGGDIPAVDSLGSFAKTLGRGLGVPQAVLDESIRGGAGVGGGKTVAGALVATV